MHLLLIEDDLELGESLLQALRGAELTAEWVRTVHDGRAFARREAYDCILLDLGLPDGHGFELLRHWRESGIDAPVIVITANSGLNDRVAGLQGGADDYLAKPFAVKELLARIGAVTRRASGQAHTVWQVGRIAIDTARREVQRDGEIVDLAPREYALLMTLARARGEVVTKHRLAQALTPLGDPVDFNAIEVHVHHLRRKLGAELIRTVRGVGYLLEV